MDKQKQGKNSDVLGLPDSRARRRVCARARIALWTASNLRGTGRGWVWACFPSQNRQGKRLSGASEERVWFGRGSRTRARQSESERESRSWCYPVILIHGARDAGGGNTFFLTRPS
jgi:hypothetical protein